MNRRGFLATLGAAFVAPFLATPAAPALASRPDAFDFMSTPLYTRGDIVHVPGIFATHPLSGATLPTLKMFVVIEDEAIGFDEPLRLHPDPCRRVSAIDVVPVRCGRAIGEWQSCEVVG